MSKAPLALEARLALKAPLALIGGMLAIALLSVQPASAISVELAKKCREAAMKAHPPQRPGSKSGAAKAQHEYFRKCVANDGKVEGDSKK